MYRKISFLALMLALIIPVTARAEVKVGVGFAAGVSPYKDYDTQWSFYPHINYEGERFFVKGLSAGVKLFDFEGLQFSVFLAYDPRHFDAGDSSDFRLRRLDNRHEGLLVGGQAQWAVPLGGSLHASLGGDVSGHSQGFVGRLAYLYPFNLQQVTLIPQIGTYWASDDYHNYYYGVSGREAWRSGLSAYQSDSAFSPFLGLTVNLSLDEHWGLFWHGELTALPGEIKDSPMVDRSSIYNMATGVTYTFK